MRRSALTPPLPAPSFRPTSMGDPFPVSEEPQSERLKALEARLNAVRARTGAGKTPYGGEHYSQAQLAWRMVVELVAGLGIGFAIGYGLDSLLGTRPWLMVVFTVLGFIAGVKTMIRSAAEMQAENRCGRNGRADARGRAGGREREGDLSFGDGKHELLQHDEIRQWPHDRLRAHRACRCALHPRPDGQLRERSFNQADGPVRRLSAFSGTGRCAGTRPPTRRSGWGWPSCRSPC